MKNESISHGTLRTQDLIPAFLDAVQEYAPAEYESLISMSESKSFQENCLSKFSADFEAAADKIAARSKKYPEGAFVIFVDGMDGDKWKDWIDTTSAVTHAFRHGATEVVIKRWPEQGNKTPSGNK